MAGFIADIFAPWTFLGVTIAQMEGAITITEGIIADIEGFFADLFAWMGFIFEILFYLFVFYLALIFVIDMIILLTFGTQEIYDIEDNIANVGILLDTFFNKTFKEFFTKYLTSSFQCAGKMIKNFPGCFFWYILEVIGQLIYLPFRLIFWIFCLQNAERMGWALISKIDDYIKSVSNISFIHYPDFVIQDCYMCNLEELPVVQPAPKMKSEPIPYLINPFG